MSRKKDKDIRALHVPSRFVGPAFVDIPNTLDALHEHVGGYVETFRLCDELYERGLVGLCNEDGQRLELKPNRAASALASRVYLTDLLGDVLVLRTRGAEFASLNDEDEQVLRKMLDEIGATVTA